jgi:Tol biopolymer transport system component
MKKNHITTIAILFCLAISLSLPASAAPQMAGDTIRISLTNAGGEGNGESQYPAIAPDGGYFAFQSGADNLVSNDTNGVSDIFVRDEAGGKTVRVSVSTNGSQGNGPSNFPAISATGR